MDIQNDEANSEAEVSNIKKTGIYPGNYPYSRL